MSPRLALESPVFLFYLAASISLLTLGGIVLGVLKWCFHKEVDQAWRAYCGWLIIVPILLAVFFLGRTAAISFITIVSIIVFNEFARAARVTDDWIVTGIVDLSIIATGAFAWMSDSANIAANWYTAFLTLPVFAIVAIVAVPIVRNRARGQLQLVALATFGFMYFGWMLCHLSFLANSGHAYSYLGFLIFAVELNDVAAYVCGRCLGRHQLCSDISPKKNWEGALGALAVSCTLPWVLTFTFPHFDSVDCVGIGLIIGIGAPLGDLVVSMSKRDLGIKDMGKILIGHGGILDRIDSLIFVAPLYFHFLRIRHGTPLP